MNGKFDNDCKSAVFFTHQVDLMYNIENNMPKFVQKAVHVKRATIKPNEPPSSVWQKVYLMLYEYTKYSITIA